MKIPAYHKYYSANVLIYTLFINIIFACCNFYEATDLCFKIPYEKFSLYLKTLFILNVYIIPAIIICVVIEFLLRKCGVITKQNTVTITKYSKILIYFFALLALLVFFVISAQAHWSQIPYTPEQLEALRYD